MKKLTPYIPKAAAALGLVAAGCFLAVMIENGFCWEYLLGLAIGLLCTYSKEGFTR